MARPTLLLVACASVWVLAAMLAVTGCGGVPSSTADTAPAAEGGSAPAAKVPVVIHGEKKVVDKVVCSDAEWRTKLSPEQYQVL
nr:hypothetical protein [Acidobacteriota bacterium]